MSLDDRTILVVGGTGFLGQPVVWTLDHFGFPVRILSRDTNKARQIFGNHFDIVKGDIEDAGSLQAALDGCYGVHISLKGSGSAEDIDRMEHQGTSRIIAAAKEKNVRRVSYLSGASTSPERFWFPPTRAKYMAEQAIINSGLEYAIFRATWFMESLPLFVRGDKAILMGKQPFKWHWIAAEDYAKIVAQAFMHDDPPNGIFNVFGPEEYTTREALEIYCALINPQIKIMTMPIGLLKFIAAITFNRELKDVLPLMEYFENNGELGNSANTDELFGQPKITLENWCKCYKERIKQ